MGTMSNELKLIDILNRLVTTIERCDLNGTKTSDSFVFKEAKEVLEDVERDHIQMMRELRRLYEAKEEAAHQRLLAFLEEMASEGSEDDNDEQDQEGVRES
jgi:hypothetical protein